MLTLGDPPAAAAPPAAPKKWVMELGQLPSADHICIGCVLQ
jgi:hypothetical protein